MGRDDAFRAGAGRSPLAMSRGGKHPYTILDAERLLSSKRRDRSVHAVRDLLVGELILVLQRALQAEQLGLERRGDLLDATAAPILPFTQPTQCGSSKT